MPRIESLGVLHDELYRCCGREEVIPYHRMYGKQYVLPSVTRYSAGEAEKLRVASERLDRVYRKVLRWAQRELPDIVLIKLLGLHPAMLTAARMEVPMHGVSRQDWILDPAGEWLKCIENNTDTPTGIPETAWLAGSVLKERTTYRNPSAGMDQRIREAFTELIQHYRAGGEDGDLVFSSYGDHTEDAANTRYLMERVREAGYEARYAPLEDIEIIPNEGVFHEGGRIGIWYRLYPMEYLVWDEDSEGRPIGRDVFQLMEQGKLCIINPAQSVITQSKGFMALIWSLYEHGKELAASGLIQSDEESLFTAEEADTIKTYLLPTYTTPDLFQNCNQAYVAKGYWGREGKGTVLYDEAGMNASPQAGDQHVAVDADSMNIVNTVDPLNAGDAMDAGDPEETAAYYNNQQKVYQQRISMEKVRAESEHGLVDGYLLTGVYVIGGKFAGILPRVGGLITGDLAYFCPAAVVEQVD
ncbi:hypothetical protein SY83_08545 [Paenibacillus swuensis]|uniref:Glutathionylspermidine synthase pre-ATP-grasp-like domain-containing protein n=1 Tax=Paenibacillus swuensis TaxID=1178515 RepID=A0A172TGY2_9BACL|nr:glutathionylspermidine synthase family protein [Paenibacillus swuensis]ANE46318.1 hypothetical protein SY83_08545 [Paenibacillus swuensis]